MSRTIVEEILKRGYNITPDALELLMSVEKPMQLLKRVLDTVAEVEEKPLFLTKDLFESALRLVKEEAVSAPAAPSPRALKVQPKIKILKSAKVTAVSGTEAADFLTYFKSRFKRLRKTLEGKPDAWGAISTKDLVRASGMVKVIGMVSQKVERKRFIFLRLEDEHGAIDVTIPSTKTVFKKGQEVLLDEVICVMGSYRAGRIFADEIIWPDVPSRKLTKPYADEPIYAVLTSDLHIGSKAFLQGAFDRFLDWLNGKLRLEFEADVKYLIIAGDLVDGVGVYPNQETELSIVSIKEQYQIAAKYLRRVPKHIEIIIIPGNHDGVRQALPQPPIPKEVAGELYEMENVHLLTNPSLIDLHGVKFLLYHGKSFEDVVKSQRRVSHQHPSKIMERLLRSRHLAPVYGGNTPLAPEVEDELVLESVDFDVFHAGHIHIHDCGVYRGILLVNSGTWQLETEYQRRMGITPTPGLVSVLNLQSLELEVLNFGS